jgi:MoxR-like ATPase
LAEPTLGHRVILTPSARVRNLEGGTLIRDIVRSMPVPGARPTVGR